MFRLELGSQSAGTFGDPTNRSAEPHASRVLATLRRAPGRRTIRADVQREDSHDRPGNRISYHLSQVGLPPGRRGRHVSLSCALRWTLNGVRLPSGEIVRLEAIRLGGRWLTSIEALQRFAERQTCIGL